MAQEFDRNRLNETVDQISKAMTEKAIELGAIPNSCHTECSISIGPDGKPVYTCRVICGW